MTSKYFAQAKVTVRKQIAIPKVIQEKLGNIKEGEYLLFYEENNKIYIEKGAIEPVKKNRP
ncbi:MAG: AbrB/MazE/SpoVT family DNA-binding domain-containing protein [Candidatus Thermoplasmatota archaeon]|nr:AbrB/MazE/SpoVT family DNA-binding domain-containing protein [Euryarchaeota archaeon]MBU4031185.1 AbrB/MazE/SpoVT family DNA-binding domain-containing protein [Candidatus Thermoplasmatota archaeon]MBU4143553.1 AbrB/MazE/SpoVT family DNA-binding domain-containing protein [Candidatus Thermoplasmatota archaeon]MBU4591267.1 AbrB/MazE/SpoVT family DNA-binding domain-containing protein [Candidatus Thermoplasmatota archaeon]